PAIALAGVSLDENEQAVETPSDHVIKDEDEYKEVSEKAKEFADEDKLVSFGITPTFAETGLGYIESVNYFDVKAFHENPVLQSA
ncbi:sugar phosphate nucleotidyltransferase, partial [Aliarcobacter butzleri]